MREGGRHADWLSGRYGGAAGRLPARLPLPAVRPAQAQAGRCALLLASDLALSLLLPLAPPPPPGGPVCPWCLLWLCVNRLLHILDVLAAGLTQKRRWQRGGTDGWVEGRLPSAPASSLPCQLVLYLALLVLLPCYAGAAPAAPTSALAAAGSTRPTDAAGKAATHVSHAALRV